MVFLPDGRLLPCLHDQFTATYQFLLLLSLPFNHPGFFSLDNQADSYLRAFVLLFPQPGIVFHRYPLVFLLHQLPVFVQISRSMRSIQLNPSYTAHCPPPCLTGLPIWTRPSLTPLPWASFLLFPQHSLSDLFLIVIVYCLSPPLEWNLQECFCFPWPL